MEAIETGSPRQREQDLDPGRLLTLVERRVAARLATALGAAGGTVEEWRVLSLLSDSKGHAMSEIAEWALMPPPTLTKLVDRMVSANRVYRRVDDTDRRRVLVFLSERGRTAHRHLSSVVTTEGESLATAIGAEETALLGALLARVAARLP